MEQGGSTLVLRCPLANSLHWSLSSQCESDINLSGLYFGLKQVLSAWQFLRQGFSGTLETEMKVLPAKDLQDNQNRPQNSTSGLQKTMQ